MFKSLAVIAVLAITSLLGACGGGEATNTASTPTPAISNKVVIIGSTTLLPAAQKAVEAFRKQKPEAEISLTGGGSMAGINALTDKIADIAMSSRQLKEEEKTKLNKRNLEVKEHIVAWDGIVPIVHPSNPVKNLTTDQLKGIFTGKITDWQEVGGRKGPIILVSRDFTSGTHEIWAELALDNQPVAEAAQIKSTSEAVLEMTAATPNAIGYDGIDYVSGNSRIKAISVDGTAASAATVMDKSYKIARPIFMLTLSNPNTTTSAFLNFILSPDGQALVKEAKLVPVK